MFKLYMQLKNQHPEERSFWKWYKFGSDKMRFRSSEEGLNELQLMPSVVEVMKKFNRTNHGVKDGIKDET